MLWPMRAASLPPDPPEPRTEAGLRSVDDPVSPQVATQTGEASETPDPRLGLELLRSLADQELARAETARARSRQSFALAAGFFAVVQTVAYGAFVTKLATEGHRTTDLINHTAWAALALAVCGFALVIAELPLRSYNLTPERITQTLESADTENAVVREFTHDYALIVESHRLANRVRFRFVVCTQLLALASIALVVWELLVALDASL